MTNRRQFLGSTLAAASLLPLSALAGAPVTTPERKLKVLCVGAHPDDPETGCGGTLARFAAAGHETVIAYLTRGEAGIHSKNATEAAAIRSAEAEAACKLLQARPVFLGQTDANTAVDNGALQLVRDLLAREAPDLIFAHWPIDSHRDHQVASLLTVQAWMKSDRRAVPYFYEVCAGRQTMGFRPTDWVDITAVQALKRRAVFCHASQNPAHLYADDAHDAMENFRGLEAGVKAAEGFVRLTSGGLAPFI